MIMLQHNPSYILGQLVGTAECLQKVVEILEKQDKYRENPEIVSCPIDPDLEVHQLALALLERELQPYEPFLLDMGKGDLLADMKRIFYLKVKIDFTDEFLDQNAYEQGYTEQIEKHRE